MISHWWQAYQKLEFMLLNVERATEESKRRIRSVEYNRILQYRVGFVIPGISFNWPLGNSLISPVVKWELNWKGTSHGESGMAPVTHIIVTWRPFCKSRCLGTFDVAHRIWHIFRCENKGGKMPRYPLLYNF